MTYTYISLIWPHFRIQYILLSSPFPSRGWNIKVVFPVYLFSNEYGRIGEWNNGYKSTYNRAYFWKDILRKKKKNKGDWGSDQDRNASLYTLSMHTELITLTLFKTVLGMTIHWKEDQISYIIITLYLTSKGGTDKD